MSKMSELSLTLDELAEAGRRLTECGELLTKTALSIRECFTAAEPEQTKPAQKNDTESMAETPQMKTPQPESAPPVVSPAKVYTKEEVRALLAKKSVEGFREQAKALVKKYGGGSLTDIDPARYPELIKEAEALGNE